LSLGARVECGGTTGVVRYIGLTLFATGRWVGVELAEPKGKNDGSVMGKRYFDCKQDYGMFVRTSQIK
ncbi:Eb1cEB3C HETERODIMER in complex WITH the CAP-Gly domain of P150glued, partial [Blyttiomyces helicus]